MIFQDEGDQRVWFQLTTSGGVRHNDYIPVSIQGPCKFFAASANVYLNLK